MINTAKSNKHTKKYESQTKQQANFIAIVIAIMTAVAIILSIIYQSTVIEIKKVEADSIITHKDAQFEQLWTTVTDTITKEAENNISQISKNIETEINMLDLEQLKTDLDKGTYPTELIDIFKSNLGGVCLNGIDNGRNNTLVVTNDKILVNYSYHMYPNNAQDQHLFSSILESGWNVKLGKDAISKLYRHDNDIICIEFAEPQSDNHIKLNTATKSNFKLIYEQEGLEGFKNYQILVPIYITDTGDIFGQDDIILGELNPNHKFIIIQEFNIYDQVSDRYQSYFDKTHIDDLDTRYEQVLRNLYIIGIIFVIFVVIVMLELIATYNNFVKKEEIEKINQG